MKLGDKEGWTGIYDLLTENSGSVVEELVAIQAIGQSTDPRIAKLSLLRVLDIVVWMEHSVDHRRPHKPSLAFK
jgi:hypothetical protein